MRERDKINYTVSDAISLFAILSSSIGRSLRALAESEPKPMTENFAIKEAIAAGEMVSRESLEKLIHSNILQMMNKKGIIIDGYPREMNQILDFQDKVKIKRALIACTNFLNPFSSSRFSIIKNLQLFFWTAQNFNWVAVDSTIRCHRSADD